MKSLDSCKIRKDLLLKVIECIFSQTNITRKDISEKCSICPATAGKAVDFFRDAKLVTEKRSVEMRSGPRPMLINLNRKYNCQIIDISGNIFKGYLTDIFGNSLLFYEEKKPISGDFDSRLDNFAEIFNQKCKYLKPEYRFGVGFIVPENLDTLAFDANKLFETCESISKKLEVKRFEIMTKADLAERFCSASFSDQTVLYICINRSSSFSAAFVNGHRISGLNNKSFDVTDMDFDGTSVNNAIETADPDKLCNVLTKICKDSTAYLDPHCIYIDSEDISSIRGLALILKQKLDSIRDKSMAIPEIISTESIEPPLLCRSLVLSLRESFKKDIENSILDSRIN